MCPLVDHKLDALRNDMHVKSGSFSVSIASVSKFLMDMASWVEEFITYLEESLRKVLFCDLGMMYMNVCDKVNSIVVH